MKSVRLIFVYGTLLRGERNHALLAASRFAGEARTPPEFELADLGTHPAMVSGGRVAVTGETWEVDEATLARLDELEEVLVVYERKPIPLADGRVADAYLMPPGSTARAPRIPGGDWRTRLPAGPIARP